MEERSLVFPADEFRMRVARMQTEMSSRELDALLLTTASDIFYLTGFLTRFWESPARPWYLIIPASGDPTAVIPSIGAALMERTWISRIRTWDAPNPHDDGVSLLVDTICALLPQKARIGVPQGLETHLRMPLADFDQVANGIAPRTFVDGTAPVQRVREIKSNAEVEKIRMSCDIAGRAFSRVPEFAGVGRPLDAVFRDFQVALLQEGADWVSYVAGGAGPNGYENVISPAGPEPLGPDDVLMLDTGCVRDGYFCDFDRNFLLGCTTEAVRQTHAALWHAIEDALGALRPGMEARDGHRILSEALIKRGATPGGGRLGHGLGVTLTEWPSFTPLDTTELREGMVLTLEPSAYVESGRMLVLEENLVLRSNGPELLSRRAPVDPMELS